MTAYVPSYPESSTTPSSPRTLNTKVSMIKMPAAFKVIQQPQQEGDSVDPADPISFDSVKLSTEPANHVTPDPSTSSNRFSTGRLFSRPVHRAKSTPSLSLGLRKSSSRASTTSLAPPLPDPRRSTGNLVDNRFSSASHLTTSTDRSSSGSTMNAKALQHKTDDLNLSINNPLHSDSHASTTIEINSDYADSSEPNTPMNEDGNVKNLHTTQSVKRKQRHTSKQSSDSNGQSPSQPPTVQLLTKDKKEPGRDRYGFKKQTQFVTEDQYDEWWAGYQQHVQRRKKKWVSLMKESGLSTENDRPVRFPAKSEKLKRYIRKGIPAEWRGNAWFFYSKGHEKLSSNKGLYDKLCAQTVSLKNSDTELIERDLHRTFPDNIHFRSDSAPDGGRSRETEAVLIKSLRRVLTAFSVFQPKIGYCQSLNFLAGLLLLFMDEEKAFWMLVIITQRYLPGVHEITLEGVNIDQGVLMLCVRESLPKMWDKIGVNFDGQHYNNILAKLPPITLCTAAWFMSGYIGILPIETTLRVWDCFFFEESKTFFRIALTIFKFCEPEVEGLEDPMEIFQVVQTMPKRLIDASALLSACFKRRNGFGHISQDEVKRLRDFVRDRRVQANLAALQETNEGASAAPAAGLGLGLGSETAASSVSLGRPSRYPAAGGGQMQVEYSSNDLSEYSSFKHAPRPLHVQLSRRMRSLKLSSRSAGAGRPTSLAK